MGCRPVRHTGMRSLDSHHGAPGPVPGPVCQGRTAPETKLTRRRDATDPGLPASAESLTTVIGSGSTSSRLRPAPPCRGGVAGTAPRRLARAPARSSPRPGSSSGGPIGRASARESPARQGQPPRRAAVRCKTPRAEHRPHSPQGGDAPCSRTVTIAWGTGPKDLQARTRVDTPRDQGRMIHRHPRREPRVVRGAGAGSPVAGHPGRSSLKFTDAT